MSCRIIDQVIHRPIGTPKRSTGHRIMLNHKQAAPTALAILILSIQTCSGYGTSMLRRRAPGSPDKGADVFSETEISPEGRNEGNWDNATEWTNEEMLEYYRIQGMVDVGEEKQQDPEDTEMLTMENWDDEKVWTDEEVMEYYATHNMIDEESRDEEEPNDSFSHSGDEEGPSHNKTVSMEPSDEPMLTLPKMEYRWGEPVVVNFSVGNNQNDIREWKVGIYMRMANPQAGDLPPIVSIKLCGLSECAENVRSGSLKFSYDNKIMMGDWPMNIYEYGTGYDIFILDQDGDAASDPIMFNVKQDNF